MHNDYSDIINLNYQIVNHPRMSIYNRAAQFAPFAALTGYEDEILEVSRITDDKVELDNDDKLSINNKLNFIKDNIKKDINIRVKHFIKDNKKCGGKYISVSNTVKKIDDLNGFIYLKDNTKIKIDNICELSIINII